MLGEDDILNILSMYINLIAAWITPDSSAQKEILSDFKERSNEKEISKIKTRYSKMRIPPTKHKDIVSTRMLLKELLTVSEIQIFHKAAIYHQVLLDNDYEFYKLFDSGDGGTKFRINAVLEGWYGFYEKIIIRFLIEHLESETNLHILQELLTDEYFPQPNEISAGGAFYRFPQNDLNVILSAPTYWSRYGYENGLDAIFNITTSFDMFFHKFIVKNIMDSTEDKREYYRELDMKVFSMTLLGSLGGQPYWFRHEESDCFRFIPFRMKRNAPDLRCEEDLFKCTHWWVEVDGSLCINKETYYQMDKDYSKATKHDDHIIQKLNPIPLDCNFVDAIYTFDVLFATLKEKLADRFINAIKTPQTTKGLQFDAHDIKDFAKLVENAYISLRLMNRDENARKEMNENILKIDEDPEIAKIKWNVYICMVIDAVNMLQRIGSYSENMWKLVNKNFLHAESVIYLNSFFRYTDPGKQSPKHPKTEKARFVYYLAAVNPDLAFNSLSKVYIYIYNHMDFTSEDISIGNKFIQDIQNGELSMMDITKRVKNLTEYVPLQIRNLAWETVRNTIFQANNKVISVSEKINIGELLDQIVKVEEGDDIPEYDENMSYIQELRHGVSDEMVNSKWDSLFANEDDGFVPLTPWDSERRKIQGGFPPYYY